MFNKCAYSKNGQWLNFACCRTNSGVSSNLRAIPATVLADMRKMLLHLQTWVPSAISSKTTTRHDGC